MFRAFHEKKPKILDFSCSGDCKGVNVFFLGFYVVWLLG